MKQRAQHTAVGFVQNVLSTGRIQGEIYERKYQQKSWQWFNCWYRAASWALGWCPVL